MQIKDRLRLESRGERPKYQMLYKMNPFQKGQWVLGHSTLGQVSTIQPLKGRTFKATVQLLNQAVIW